MRHRLTFALPIALVTVIACAEGDEVEDPFADQGGGAAPAGGVGGATTVGGSATGGGTPGSGGAFGGSGTGATSGAGAPGGGVGGSGVGGEGAGGDGAGGSGIGGDGAGGDGAGGTPTGGGSCTWDMAAIDAGCDKEFDTYYVTSCQALVQCAQDNPDCISAADPFCAAVTSGPMGEVKSPCTDTSRGASWDPNTGTPNDPSPDSNPAAKAQELVNAACGF